MTTTVSTLDRAARAATRRRLNANRMSAASLLPGLAARVDHLYDRVAIVLDAGDHDEAKHLVEMLDETHCQLLAQLRWIDAYLEKVV